MIELILIGIVIGSLVHLKRKDNIMNPSEIPTKKVPNISSEELAKDWEKQLIASANRYTLTEGREFKEGDTVSPYRAILRMKD